MIAAISSSVSWKSKIAMFSASRSGFVVRGMAATPGCWMSQRDLRRRLAVVARGRLHGLLLEEIAAATERRICDQGHAGGPAHVEDLRLAEVGMVFDLIGHQRRF